MDPKLVNDTFKKGIPALMGGFNPWGFGTWLQAIKNQTYFKYTVPLTELPMLEKFAANVERVANTFFQWDQERYKDPCDQCFDLNARKGEILDMTFEGIEITPEALRESLSMFSMFFSFKHDLEFMLRNIES